MISFDFEYHKPTTAPEAVALFQELENQGKQPRYYAGGTEILTLGRLDLFITHAVIDIKNIPEFQKAEADEDWMIFGAGVTLTELEEKNLFPLLSKSAREVADHTARNKITLGGNICGHIFYREAVLPLLLADSQLAVADLSGINLHSIHDLFQRRLQLKKGELLVQVFVETKYADLPYMSIKERQQWDTGYPLVTVAALKTEENIRVAFSGVCAFPFRSAEIEEVLNHKDTPLEARIQTALDYIPAPILNDGEGSDQYRKFVIKNLLFDIFKELGGT
ncbi:FAD binding domain-containing protein [Priestia megaterium]|uniref:FAD binding domain-containing protein n=1 Tax=Priestia megaterium TaxID=1404 RepID=UPI00249C53A2|nr:FAD binding domain-containing protein [Priestia megaterium]MDI3092963.1 FAD binding domain-containing protein [Priestia megaterium]